MLCQYSDALGKPRQSVHKTRIAGLAAFDVLGTLLVAYVFRSHCGFVNTALVLWAVGTAMHLLFCVRTPVTDLLLGRG